MAKSRDNSPISPDVLDWFRNVFAAANAKVSNKIARVPNAPEESLDMTLIEHLSGYGVPHLLQSGWTVRIDTHFLGGLRHFHGKWEIADIGLLVHYRRNGKLVRSKAAVLQSKRLYPRGVTVKEDMSVDYEVGFARLADPEDIRVPLHIETSYDFDFDCRYAALQAHDEQYDAIKKFLPTNKVPVFYQFYNPPLLPFTQTVPVKPNYTDAEAVAFGTRIVAAKDIIVALAKRAQRYSPTVADLSNKKNEFDFGFRLETFVADLLIACKEGYAFNDLHDENIFALFNRRSGAIAAAVAFSIEAPE
jgi:hypothetical protein